MLPILFNWPFPIYSYPLFLGLACGIAYNYSLSVADAEKIDALKFKLYSLGLFISSWVGAKIFFWIFSAEKSSAVITSMNFWMGGGFVFFGGLVFGTLFTIIHHYYFKIITLDMITGLLPGLCLGHAVGRIGCLLAGCCFGKQFDSPMKFFGHELYKHPVQIYEILILLSLFFYFRMVLKRRVSSKIQTILTYFIAYASFRFVIEFIRADTIRGVYGPFSSSQWVSIVIILTSVTLFMRIRYRPPSKLGESI